MSRSRLISIVLTVCLVLLTPSMAFAQMGLDLNGYCVAQGYSGVTLVENTAYGWRCITSSGETMDMNLYDACASQHGSAYPTPQFSDFNNPNSWACYGNSQPPPPSPAQAPSCNVSTINVSPTSGNSGTVFTISGSGSCNTGVRAIRLKVNGNVFYELGSPSVSATWNSSGSGDGVYTATVEVAGQGDDNWSYAASSSVQFSVGSQSVPPQQPPPSNSENGGGNSGSNSGGSGSGNGSGSSRPRVVYGSCPAGNAYVQITATSGLRIRSGAGVNNSILALAAFNNCFELANTSASNGWYEIKYSGGRGWVSGEFTQVYSNDTPPQTSPSSNPRITRHSNGWCSAKPVDVDFNGFDPNVWYPNPLYQMFFDNETNLGRLRSDQYYVYYRDQYVGPDVAKLEGPDNNDPNTGRWQFGIDSTWAFNDGRWNNENAWRVDYYCGS